MNIYKQRIGLINKVKPNGLLLEIGCSRGYFLHLAREAGYTVEGLEISPIAAEFAASHFGLNVVSGNIENISLDNLYDIIVMWHVLEHLANPVPVLLKLYDALKPGGALVIEVPNLHSLKFMLASNQNKWQGGNHPRFHLSFFCRRTLNRLIQKSGFNRSKRMFINYTGKRLSLLVVIKSALQTLNMDSFLTIKTIKPIKM